MKYRVLFSSFLLLGSFSTQGAQYAQNIRGNVLHGNLWFADPYLDDRFNTSLGSSEVCQKFEHLLPILRGTRGAITIPLIPHGPETEHVPNLLAVIEDCHSRQQPFVFTLLYDGMTFFILTDEENSYPCHECAELGRYALYPSDLSNPWLQRIPPDSTPAPIFYTNVLIFRPVILVPLVPYYVQYYPSLPAYPQTSPAITDHQPPIRKVSPEPSPTEESAPSAPTLPSAPHGPSETQEPMAATSASHPPSTPPVADEIQEPGAVASGLTARSYATIAASAAALSTPFPPHPHVQKEGVLPTTDGLHHTQGKAPYGRKPLPIIVRLPQRGVVVTTPSSPSPSLTAPSKSIEGNLSDITEEVNEQKAGAAAPKFSRNQRKKMTQKARKASLHVSVVQTAASLPSSPPPLIARPMFGPQHPRIVKKAPVERIADNLVARVIKNAYTFVRNHAEEEQHTRAANHFKNNDMQAALTCYEQLDLTSLLTRSFDDCFILVQIFLTLSPEQRSAHVETEKLVRKKAKAFFTSQRGAINGSQLQPLCRFLIEDKQDLQYFEYVQAGSKCGDTECTYLSLEREVEHAARTPTLCSEATSEQCPHHRALAYIETHKHTALTSLTAMHLFIQAHLTPCPCRDPHQPSAILVERVLRTAEQNEYFLPDKLSSLRALQAESSQKDEEVLCPTTLLTPLENISKASEHWNRSRVLKETANDVLLTKAYLKQARAQLEAKTASGAAHDLHEKIMLLYILLHTKSEFYVSQDNITLLNEFVEADVHEQDETAVNMNNTIKGLACFCLALHYTKVQHLSDLTDQAAYERALRKGLELKNPDCIALIVYQQRKRHTAAAAQEAHPQTQRDETNLTKEEYQRCKDTDLTPEEYRRCMELLQSKWLTGSQSSEAFTKYVLTPLQRSIMDFTSPELTENKTALLKVLEKILSKVPRTSLIDLLEILVNANPQPEEYVLLLDRIYDRSKQQGTDLTREQREALVHCIKALCIEYIAPPNLAAKQPKDFKRAQKKFLETIGGVKLPQEKRNLSSAEIVTQTQSLFRKR